MNLVALAIMFMGASVTAAIWALVVMLRPPGQGFALLYMVIMTTFAAAAGVAFVIEYVDSRKQS